MKYFIKSSLLLFTFLISFGSIGQDYSYGGKPKRGELTTKEWSIKAYDILARADSANAKHHYEGFLVVARSKKMKNPPVYEDTHWLGKNQKKLDVKAQAEFEQNHRDYDARVERIKMDYENNLKEIAEYRNKWVGEIIKKQKEKEEYKRQQVLEKEQKRIQEEKEQEEYRKKKAEEEKERLAMIKAMPTNPEYLQWKRKFEGLLASSTASFKRSEAVIKKYLYRNAFGQLLYNSDKFSQTDKNTVKKNLQTIYDNNTKLNELKEDKYDDFFWYWNDKASMEMSAKQYNYYNYYNEKSWEF